MADIEEVLRRLEKAYPGARIALEFSNPLELLVAAVLSAQATDKKVNEVTRQLFRRYRTAKDYAYADPGELEQDIRATGFYHHKARSIINAARMIEERFGGQVPDSMYELLTLPGVGSKTANVILYNAFGKQEGIAVDTHVRRLSRRLGLTQSTDPDKIEQDLMTLVPRERWGQFTYLLIEHGRAVCTARKPACNKCILNDLCPSAFKV